MSKMMNMTWLLLPVLLLALVACRDTSPTTADDGEGDSTPADSEKGNALKARLDAKQASWAAGAPQSVQDTYDEGIRRVADTGVLDTMIGVGDTAPGFTLPDATGKDVVLADLLKDGPVVVVFYRGAWCPYCNLTLAEWQGRLEEIQALGGQLVAISPQTPDASLTSQEKNDLAFPVLSDVGNKTADAFGITTQVTPEILAIWEGRIDLEAHNADASGKLPLPATYLIDTAGKVRFAHADADYRVRAEPQAVIDLLKTIQAR